MPADQQTTDPRFDPDDAEDAKLVALARSTRARIDAAEGACVRDPYGRTYAGASVALASLRAERRCRWPWRWRSPAVRAASRRPRSSAVRPTVNEADLSVVRDLAGGGVAVHLAAPDGTVVASVQS